MVDFKSFEELDTKGFKEEGAIWHPKRSPTKSNNPKPKKFHKKKPTKSNKPKPKKFHKNVPSKYRCKSCEKRGQIQKMKEISFKKFGENYTCDLMEITYKCLKCGFKKSEMYPLFKSR